MFGRDVTIPSPQPVPLDQPDGGRNNGRNDQATDFPPRGGCRAGVKLIGLHNPYDPVQRTIGGGLIGAGSGAAIGAAAGGGHGAALGAAVGGAVGAIGGLITTPPPPRYRY